MRTRKGTRNNGATLIAQKAKSLIDSVKTKELLFFDLIFMKPRAPQYLFDIRNHLRVTTRVRNRVTMIKAKPVSMLAHNVLDSTGFALPTWFCPGPADGWYVRQPSGA
jgi:hypothetical protein